MKKTDNTSLIFDLRLFGSQREALLEILDSWLSSRVGLKVILTPNPEQVVQAEQNPDFKQVLQRADLLLPDGIGLVFAARFLSLLDQAQPIKQRITGISVVEDLLARAWQRDLEVLVIGGRDYSPGSYFACRQLKVHWTAGYEDAARPNKQEERAVIQLIEKLKPKLVFVALGAPRQEFWLEQHRDLLENNGVKIAMAVGGSFDYLLGKVGRAPDLVQRLGMEWLYRLWQEPWRFKRQLRLVTFSWLTIKSAIKNIKQTTDK